jgi:hypothetical protein
MARVTGLEPATSGVTGQSKTKFNPDSVSTLPDIDLPAFSRKVETDFAAAVR